MTALNNKPANNDFSIFVAFHIPNEVNSSSAAARIIRFLEEEFGAIQTKVIDVSSLEFREIIFKIQKPLLKGDEAQYEFFEKLNEIFLATAQYNPHFTQLDTESARGVSKR